MEWKQNTGTGPLIALPLDELLRNNIALFYFIDFMMSIGAQAYLYFYLNVEGIIIEFIKKCMR
jgi:sorting nexin-13